MVSFWWLLALIASLLLVLGWVGWWFFARTTPLPAAGSSSAMRLLLPRWRAAVAAIRAALPRRAPPQRNGAWRILLAVAVVLLAAVSVVYAMGGLIRVDPLSALPGVFGARIGQAFAPDDLAPPAPLPPDLFVSADDPGLETADRDWAKLDAGFRQSVLWMIERARQRGVVLVLLEGYRSPERQERLANLGASVTRAGAFQSKHQFGLAADLVPMRDGHLAMSEAEPWAAEAYRMLGEEAEQVGLVWGGRWTLRDLGHVEASGGASIARRR